jgi:uncharacterized membrane protein/protein-disulfide isomerase
MMPFLNLSQNCEFVTYSFIKKLNVSVTKGFIRKQLEEHPDYPSMLAVSDVLNNIGIENRAYKIGPDKLTGLPVPYIAQVIDNGNKYFTIVNSTNEGSVNYLDPVKNFNHSIEVKDFDELFTGVILLGVPTEAAGQKDYIKSKGEENRKNAANILMIAALPVLCILACISCFFTIGVSSIAPIIFTLITLIGTLIGALITWYEADQHNPALQQICTAGTKTNCAAILNSKASKIFGVGWSLIGFTYFAGSLLTLLITRIVNLQALYILSWLNIFALPYIVFSIYYQAQVAKQWCPLCLGIQVILALQFIVAFFGKFYSEIPISSVTHSAILEVLICFTLPFLVLSILFPALRKANESKQGNTELLRLKHNPQIFEALLSKQKVIIEPVDGLGISLGDPNARNKLIKVCNPYCGPCAKAHVVIDQLLDNSPDLQVQVIFTATGEENDRKTPPVEHLLAIAAKANNKNTKHALDDWYTAKKSENRYEEFAAKYPMNGELKQQGDKIKDMNDWCIKTGIGYTPMFFLNGYQLPEIYNINDLKYFLLV